MKGIVIAGEPRVCVCVCVCVCVFVCMRASRRGLQYAGCATTKMIGCKMWSCILDALLRSVGSLRRKHKKWMGRETSEDCYRSSAL